MVSKTNARRQPGRSQVRLSLNINKMYALIIPDCFVHRQCQDEAGSDSDTGSSDNAFDPKLLMLQLKQSNAHKQRKNEKRVQRLAAQALKRIAKAADECTSSASDQTNNIQVNKQLGKIKKVLQRAEDGRMGGSTTLARADEFDKVHAHVSELLQSKQYATLPNQIDKVAEEIELAQQTAMNGLSALKQEGMRQIQHVRKKHDDPRDRKALHDIADMFF